MRSPEGRRTEASWGAIRSRGRRVCDPAESRQITATSGKSRPRHDLRVGAGTLERSTGPAARLGEALRPACARSAGRSRTGFPRSSAPDRRRSRCCAASVATSLSGRQWSSPSRWPRSVVTTKSTQLLMRNGRPAAASPTRSSSTPSGASADGPAAARRPAPRSARNAARRGSPRRRRPGSRPGTCRRSRSGRVRPPPPGPAHAPRARCRAPSARCR